MTLQRRDILILNKKQYALNRDIFKPYFTAHPDKKPNQVGFESNLRRGYFCEFKVDDDQLSVKDIRINFDFDRDTGKVISRSILEDTLADVRFCEWFTGILYLFSTSSKKEYFKMEIAEGKLKDLQSLTEDEYNATGNHAYDYF